MPNLEPHQTAESHQQETANLRLFADRQRAAGHTDAAKTIDTWADRAAARARFAADA